MKEIKLNKSNELYNMALNCLLALVVAQLSGEISNKSSAKSLFIGKWLKRAKKTKKIP